MGRNTELSIEDENGLQVASYKVPYGSKLFFQNDDKVKKGAKICEWDPYTTPVIAETSGNANYMDLVEGVSIAETVDDATGISIKTVVDWKTQSKNTDLKPRITLRDSKGNVIKKADDNEARYYLVPDSILSVKDGQKISKGDTICSWDPYNAVILSEVKGKVEFESIESGITFKEEFDEQTGHKEKVIVECRDKTKNPAIVITSSGEDKSYNIPVGAHLSVDKGEKVNPGSILSKIPRMIGQSRDITGGLPRVTELFEARNPSNPAVVSEIDGVVTYGGIKRGNREIFIESKDGTKKKYLVCLLYTSPSPRDS